MKVFYLGLEPYSARYTAQLTEWNRRVFQRRGIDVTYVAGDTLDNSQAVATGQVLDAHGRPFYALSQMMRLMEAMRRGEVCADDVIYLEDMFTPGIESLAYVCNQVSRLHQPRIFVRCLAQSIDPDDFVHVCGMAEWMAHYERMVNAMPNTTILASSEEMVAHMRIAGWTAPIYNIAGLAFGKDEVRERVGGERGVKAFDTRSKRVVFAARFDQEKQPNLFMDLVERYRRRDPSVTFAVLSGGALRSNNNQLVERARDMQAAGLLEVHEHLTKNDYYAMLNDSRVLFNCALQDWVSNTVSEADALGCNVLFPAYRSFPETFANDEQRLYIPWSLDDAMAKLPALLAAAHKHQGRIADWNDATVDRVVDIIRGEGERWRREGVRYREHVAPRKYA